MTLSSQHFIFMKTYKNLYPQLCRSENLLVAWKKARKGKTLKHYVIEFESNLQDNLAQLRTELLLHAYRARPLNTFILRDPKTRKISVSDFRDRIIHHALCNIIEPIFDKAFIFDSYANRKGKGTLAAIQRLEFFINKVSHNKTIIKKWNKNKIIRGFYFKGDIKKYFDTIDHTKLIEIIKEKIVDKEMLFLIKNILKNHTSNEVGQGMPLGNLTSQFLANVYLNELDQFVKHQLQAKYYLRYVDDFVIVDNNQDQLYFYKQQIEEFLNNPLLLTLHKDKSSIKPLYRGIAFLGFRIFPNHKLLKKKSGRRAYQRLALFERNYFLKMIDYDIIYDFLEGWMAYAKQADTFKLRRKILSHFEEKMPDVSSKEINKAVKSKMAII